MVTVLWLGSVKVALSVAAVKAPLMLGAAFHFQSSLNSASAFPSDRRPGQGVQR